MNLDDFFKPAGESVVAIPFPQERAIMTTVAQACEHSWARFLLIGDPEGILQAADEYQVPRDRIEILPAQREDQACAFTAEALRDGRADVAMKGSVHTANFSRAIFYKEYGLVEPGRLASHIGACEMPAYHKIVFLSDCAINIQPDYETKIIILKNALETVRSLGIEKPKVGLVAPVETVNKKIPATIDADRMVNEYRDGILVDELGSAVIEGPFGLDVALSAEAAATKGIESEVAGDADILLFPDLNSGNVAYKSFTYMAGATIAGNLIGPRIPVVMTSRADDDRTKLLSLKMGASLARKGSAE